MRVGSRSSDRYYYPAGIVGGKCRVDYFDSSRGVVQHCLGDSDAAVRAVAQQIVQPVEEEKARAVRAPLADQSAAALEVAHLYATSFDIKYCMAVKRQAVGCCCSRGVHAAQCWAAEGALTLTAAGVASTSLPDACFIFCQAAGEGADFIYRALRGAVVTRLAQ